ncbi:hypothetical protein [Ralstonia chuxiongensis]|uniref:Uncharacterized protein n=1 Tax=Ralstonia chuxiongensis TaxID=2957504 RepID=A0AA41WW33_9RALS|nr:hypothetical protein [Ralstonia chuxiongensis]MCP1174367.1 hypothetical protein [Ralstonia chuxiongensis]
MSTETLSREDCAPVLFKLRFTSLSARRFSVPEDAQKPGNGRIKATSDFTLEHLADGVLDVNATFEAKGTRDDIVEFEVSAAVTASFKVPEAMSHDDCEGDEAVRYVIAQLGPVIVVKLRSLMTDMGINGTALSFPDPTKRLVRGVVSSGSSE